MSRQARLIVCIALGLLLPVLILVTAPVSADTFAPPLQATSTPMPFEPRNTRSCSSFIDISGTQQLFNQIGAMNFALGELAPSLSMTPTTVINSTDPFSIVRGFYVITAGITWLNILITYFLITFVLVMVITIVRLIVSFWGVIERLIHLIELIPGM